MTQTPGKSWAGTWLIPSLLLVTALFDIAIGFTRNNIGLLCAGLGYVALAFALVHDGYRFSTSRPFFVRERRTTLSMLLSVAGAGLLIAAMVLKRTVS